MPATEAAVCVPLNVPEEGVFASIDATAQKVTSRKRASPEWRSVRAELWNRASISTVAMPY
jgi:hypothetical protein